MCHVLFDGFLNILDYGYWIETTTFLYFIVWSIKLNFLYTNSLALWRRVYAIDPNHKVL